MSTDGMNPVGDVYDAMGERPKAVRAPVDVLAALDRAFAIANGDVYAHDDLREACHTFEAARAAVAELIEATKFSHAALMKFAETGQPPYADLTKSIELSESALARCGVRA